MTNFVIVKPVKWLRSREGILAGVCEGLGKSFEIEPWVLRTVWLLSIFAFGFGVFLYLVLAICLPREDQEGLGMQNRIFGVCRRISMRTNIDIGLVRALSIFLLIFSFGATIVGYIVLHFVLQEQYR